MVKTGKDGAVMIGDVTVAKLSNWKLNIKQNLIDIAHFDNGGWNEVLGSTCSFEGSFEGSYSKNDKEGQGTIMKAITNGQDLSVDFVVDKNDPSDKFAGNVKIETFDIDTSSKEIVKISVKFKGNGALTFPQ